MNLIVGRSALNTMEFEGVFDSLETAVIYYDQYGKLSTANHKAWRILPNLGSQLYQLSDFISFIYDRSLDSDDQEDMGKGLNIEKNNKAFFDIIAIEPGIYYSMRAVERDLGTIIEMSDITPVKNYTANLRLMNGRNQILTAAIESSKKGIFIADSGEARQVIFANKVLYKLLNREGVALEGRNVDAFLSSYFADEWDKINTVIGDHQRGRFWKKMETLNDGTKWLSLNISAESECDGRRLIIGFISDETQNKLQENHLRQTQKLEAIGQLAGGVAHDFNNILSIIEGYTRLSETAIARGEDISGNLNRIKQAVLRGSGLTKQLLMFGKHRVTENKIIDLCAQIREMEGLLAPLLGVNIYLKIDAPEERIPIKTTPDTISQIVMNLVLNARDAVPSGGQIIISVKSIKDESGAYALLKVMDTGVGMPRDIIERIFDPFFTTKEQGKGTGLGLSMVYGLVQQMGSEIDVQSIVGEGTTFYIRIPTVSEEIMAKTVHSEREETKGLAGKTVLVAEDEPDLLLIMEQTLKDLNMNVLKAKNGNEALRVQDEYEGKIDFLLTDMVMPELGGLKLAELIHEVRPDTHIVFMSGYPVRGEISNVSLPHEAIFMAKPVKPDVLRSVLEKIAQGQAVDQSDATIWSA